MQKLCHRTQGIGADGLLLLQHSSIADYKMRIFNADGKEAKMCGNGLRCLVDFISILENTERIYHIEVEKVYRCQKRGDRIWVEFNTPQMLGENLYLSEELPSAYHIDSGVPHAIIEVPDLEEILVNALGRKIRFNPLFGQEGANVNFIQVLPDNRVCIRTYERGVEGETLACGTGATAVAFLAHERYQFQNPIQIQVRSGDILEFHIHTDKEKGKTVEMLGPAIQVFQGIIA